MSLWSRSSVRPLDKLKTRCFLVQKTYGHQTWQGTDMWSGEANNKLAWLSDHIIARAHLSTWKLNISSSTRPVTTKRDLRWDNYAGDLCWKEAAHCITWPSGYTVLWGHMENLEFNISLSASPLAPKTGRVERTERIGGKRAVRIKPCDHWITWSHDKSQTQNWKWLCCQ